MKRAIIALINYDIAPSLFGYRYSTIYIQKKFEIKIYFWNVISQKKFVSVPSSLRHFFWSMQKWLWTNCISRAGLAVDLGTQRLPDDKYIMIITKSCIYSHIILNFTFISLMFLQPLFIFLYLANCIDKFWSL